MCSRYSLAITREELFTSFDIKHDITTAFDFLPAYNIAPTHHVPVVTSKGLELLTWGITPWWELPKKLLFITSENLLSKSTFQSLERCVMPLTGFYEWRDGPSGEKIPVHFSSPHHPVLGFAGIRRGNECALLTTVPSEFVSQFHTRMPSLMIPEQTNQWITKGTPNLISDRFQDLTAWDVTTKMSNSKFQGKECTEPCPFTPIQETLF